MVEGTGARRERNDDTRGGVINSIAHPGRRATRAAGRGPGAGFAGATRGSTPSR